MSTTVKLEQAATYARMAQAIRYMRLHHQQQPDLKTLAEQVHMSEFHFQRQFTRWAGISPKRFMQFLTLEYAKQRLAESRNLLELADESGLSGASRLHDLFVQLEAMSPGEYKAQAAGLAIEFGLHDSPFGQVLIAKTQRGICELKFIDDLSTDELSQQLAVRWPKATLIENPTATQTIQQQLFNLPSAHQAPLTLHVKGTNFQIQVWQALLKLPFGHLGSYSTIASAIQHPQAVRAVGTAIGNNPVACLIPCHRVLRESGELGGYRWGLERKSALLAWEAAQLTTNKRMESAA
jgi:AraC family transcriptional regulator of adaptative response/methylated-DNA-[protein]-cysteine methyltransferase